MAMESSDLSVPERIKILINALDGDQALNEALSKSQDGESMLEILLVTSSKLGLRLTRDDLIKTPPIRDWIWWKNKEALLTIGAGIPRHQQDKKTKRNSFLDRFF